MPKIVVQSRRGRPKTSYAKQFDCLLCNKKVDRTQSTYLPLAVLSVVALTLNVDATLLHLAYQKSNDHRLCLDHYVDGCFKNGTEKRTDANLKRLSKPTVLTDAGANRLIEMSKEKDELNLVGHAKDENTMNEQIQLINEDAELANEEVIDEENQLDETPEICSEKHCITEIDCIINLLKSATCTKKVNQSDHLCGAAVDPESIEKLTNGSVLILKYRCQRGCKSEWLSSSQVIQNANGGPRAFLLNIRFASCALISGLLYGRLQEFATLTKLMFVKKNNFFEYQSRFCHPAIRKLHDEMLENNRNESDRLSRNGSALILAGDGRFGTVGHCSEYHTYTLKCDITNKTMFQASARTEENVPSQRLEVNMSKECIYAAIKRFPHQIACIVTDGHLSVRKFFKTVVTPEYGIEHNLDLHHAKQTLAGRMLNKTSKNDKILAKSICGQISSCFYAASKKMALVPGSKLKKQTYIVESCRAILQHVTGNHNWENNNQFSLVKRCPEHPICGVALDKTSKLHSLIYGVLYSPWFVDLCGRVTNGVETSHVESLHGVMRMLADKRISFGFDGYVARIMVATMRHDYNIITDETELVDVLTIGKSKFGKVPKFCQRRKSIDLSYAFEIIDCTIAIAECSMEEKNFSKTITIPNKSKHSDAVLTEAWNVYIDRRIFKKNNSQKIDEMRIRLYGELQEKLDREDDSDTDCSELVTSDDEGHN